MAEKFIGNYGIGGNVLPTEASEAILDIPQNRTLLIAKLTDRDPLKPVIVDGEEEGIRVTDSDGRELVRPLQNIDQVFEYYKPNVDTEFETLAGEFKKENLRFRNLADFGAKGITAQSSYLQDVSERKDEYKKVIKHVKSNRILRAVLAKDEKRQAMIDMVGVMIDELKEIEATQLKENNN